MLLEFFLFDFFEVSLGVLGYDHEGVVLVERLGHDYERRGRLLRLLAFRLLAAAGLSRGGGRGASHAFRFHFEHEQVYGPFAQVNALAQFILVGVQPLRKLQNIFDF